MEPSKEIYFTSIEEFVDKYIKSIYTTDRMNEIDSETNNIEDIKYYNDCLVSRTTKSYINWLSNVKDIKEKEKEKDMIKLMQTVEGSCIGDRYLSSRTMKYKDFYMFDCIY